jgi:hypothetical protein
MAQSQPILGGYVQYYGIYIEVMGKCAERYNYYENNGLTI